MIRLAFQPKSQFVFQTHASTTAFTTLTLPIDAEKYRRRLYVMAISGTGWLGNFSLLFTLNNNPILTLPYIQAAANQFSIKLPAGAASTSPPTTDSIEFGFAGTAYTLYPFNLVLAADKVEMRLNSSTVTGSVVRQILAVHSEDLW